MKKYRILVTGAAGFIGSHIADAYIAQGHRVSIIDDLSTGKRENLNPKAKFYKLDIHDKKRVEEVFRKERPEIVNHQAAFASVYLSVKYPARTIETNVVGTMNLLNDAKKYGAKKFIAASTGGAIYGNPDPKDLPVSEEHPKTPVSPYALSKLLMEQIITNLAPVYKIPYIIFRYGNVYGPRQNPFGEAGVIGIFSKRFKEKTRPIIFGDGSKTRDYVYVDDIVRANLAALELKKNDVFHLGRGKEISDIKIFKMVRAAWKSPLKTPIHKPVREGEILRISLDAAKAKKTFGWLPKVPLEKGLPLTVNWYKKHSLFSSRPMTSARET